MEQTLFDGLLSRRVLGWVVVFAFCVCLLGPSLEPSLGQETTAPSTSASSSSAPSSPAPSSPEPSSSASSSTEPSSTAPSTPESSKSPAEPAKPDDSKAVEPLHVAIDRMLSSTLPHLTARAVDDGLFLRRLSIDLRGVVPTGEEIKAYLADSNPNKLTNWVDQFMADPLHQERMVDWLDKTLMMRRPFGQVEKAKWVEMLRESVAKHTPFISKLHRCLRRLGGITPRDLT